MVARTSRAACLLALSTTSCVVIPDIQDLACGLRGEFAGGIACEPRPFKPPAGHCSYLFQLEAEGMDEPARFVLYDQSDGTVHGSRASATRDSVWWRIDVPETDNQLILDVRMTNWERSERDGCFVFRRELDRCNAGDVLDATPLLTHVQAITNPTLMLQNGCLSSWGAAVDAHYSGR
jgi:hypothetical protein